MWKSLPLEYLRDAGGEFLFYCNFSLRMTNVTFAAAVRHWRISLLIVILVKSFGLILLLGGIVRIRKLTSNNVIFYLLFILENSPL